MTTRRRFTSWIGLTVSLSIAAYCFVTPALAKRLGDNTRDTLLKELVNPLDRKGIDVVFGDTSAEPLGKGAVPRVARLSGMPSAPMAIESQSQAWMKEFEAGTTGFVVATRWPNQGPRPSNISQEAFLERWNQAGPGHRIFLSFTAQDAAHAQTVAKALEARGYVTFTYLRSSHEQPTFDAKVVGRIFAEADHRLVLDTQSARDSKGVAFEALFAKSRFPGGGSPDSPSSPSRPDRGPNGKGPRGGDSPRGGGPAAGPRPATSPEMEEFLKGVREDWIVTENPSSRGKLFVHRSSSGGALTGLIYLVQVEKDGTWTVYRPKRGYGGSAFGARVGSTKAPRSVSVGACSCM